MWWIWQKALIDHSLRLCGISAPSAEAEKLPPSAPGSDADSGAETYDEKLRLLAEHGSQILCLLHPKNGCAYLSDNFTRLTGLPAESAQGQAFFDLLTPESHEELRHFINSAPGTKSRPAPLALQLRHHDGRTHWYELSLCETGQGRRSAIPCLLQNIHHHVQTQESLRKAREALEIALRARSEFLAGMSHELRTPLNAIIGFTEMMQNELFGTPASPQHRDYLRHVRESGYELLSKIEDLLTLARIEHADHRLQVEALDLAEPVQKALAANTYLAFSEQVTLESHILPGACELRGDRVKLQHALSNLVACAVRASLPERNVWLSHRFEENGALTLSVRCESENPAALTAFSLAARKLPGVLLAQGPEALRLAIAREIVQMHGGSISVRSREAGEVEFLLRLPPRAVLGRKAAHILEFATGA